jgi:O-antigen ligase
MTLPFRPTSQAITASGAALCLLAGIALSRGGSMSFLLFAAIGGLAVIVIFQQLGFGTLVFWIISTGLLYPVLSIGSTDTPVSFDRVLIAGMASWLILRSEPREWSPAGRRMGFCLVLLLVVYGIRAGLTSPFGQATPVQGNVRNAAINTWIDALVLPVLLYFIVGRFAHNLERCRQLAGGMAVAGALLGLIGFAEKLVGFQLASLSGGAERIDADTAIAVVRISGPYSVPEVYALVLLVCLAATLWWTIQRGPLFYAWGALAVTLELAGLGVTLFRAAWIGAIVILISGFGLRPRRALRLVVILLLASVALSLGLLAVRNNTEVQNRIKNTKNIDGRLATYEQAVTIFKLKPVTGVGVGQFQNAQNFVPVTMVNGVEAVASPHNSFLGLLAEQGIVGLTPFLLCVIAAWRLLAELRRRARARADLVLWGCVVGACLAYLVMSLTLTMLPYGPSNAFFAILLGIAAARSASIGKGRTIPPPPRWSDPSAVEAHAG